MPLTPDDFDLLKQSHAKRVLCLGDCMLDRFVYGQVSRISPEAPVPVFQETQATMMPGGAANVVANIGTYKGLVDFISVIGTDPEAGILLETLKDHPHITPHLIKETARPTTVKTRFITNSQHLLRVDKEACTDILPETRQQILSLFKELITACDIVLFSDYNKGFFTPGLTQQLIKIAQSCKKPVVIDPKGSNYKKYDGATILTPNRSELKAATGLPVTTDADIEKAARHLIQSYNLDTVLVTRSEAGMSLITAEKAHHIATEAKQVYDVSGAGDTSVATLTLALACGIELKNACEIANVAAGIVVGKSGTATVYQEELLSDLIRKYNSHLPEKLSDLETAQRLVQQWKNVGKKIGFTNGCFDLIHPGHITLLKKAKQLCDVLIVGLNSDASVKLLKGEQRPIQNEQARAAVLSALGDTDLILIFSEPTPLHLIETLKPDILIKGSDYTINQVVGAGIVQACGGKVALIDLVPDFSTTNIVNKLAS